MEKIFISIIRENGSMSLACYVNIKINKINYTITFWKPLSTFIFLDIFFKTKKDNKMMFRAKWPPQ